MAFVTNNNQCEVPLPEGVRHYLEKDERSCGDFPIQSLGYVGNIVEGMGENGSLVMDYAYEQNIYSDSQFLKDYLTTQPIYEEETVLVADGAYAGESNSNNAADHCINHITTNLTGNSRIWCLDFGIALRFFSSDLRCLA